MRLRHSSILLFTCFSCLGFYPNRPSIAAPRTVEARQASSKLPAKPVILKPSSKGSDVQKLQTQLKKLGYFNGVVDGRYRASTQIAVAKFQKARDLDRVDGIADIATQQSIKDTLTAKNQFAPITSGVVTPKIVASPTPTPQAITKPKPAQRGLIWWSLLLLGSLGSVGALLYLTRWFHQVKQPQKSQTLEISKTETLNEVNKPVRQLLPESEITLNGNGKYTLNGHENTTTLTSSQTMTPPLTTKLLPPATTSRLAKVDIVDELIKELRSNDPKKRRKAIWDLGQQGDSRAIQPLIDLMMNADSHQSSLILAALAEIGVRTLKPVNRALAISMQDESPQVRQNAIRDLSRVYDMMAHMSQMLRHALEDPDAEVQETARYTWTQMNRMRSLPQSRNLPEDSQNDSQQ